jgi:hypothetical protein
MPCNCWTDPYPCAFCGGGGAYQLDVTFSDIESGDEGEFLNGHTVRVAKVINKIFANANPCGIGHIWEAILTIDGNKVLVDVDPYYVDSVYRLRVDVQDPEHIGAGGAYRYFGAIKDPWVPDNCWFGIYVPSDTSAGRALVGIVPNPARDCTALLCTSGTWSGSGIAALAGLGNIIWYGSGTWFGNLSFDSSTGLWKLRNASWTGSGTGQIGFDFVSWTGSGSTFTSQGGSNGNEMSGGGSIAGTFTIDATDYDVDDYWAGEIACD